LLSGDPAEDPVVNEPELGDDVERDNVADQLISALPELAGELGGRVGVDERGRGRHVQLQDQQGDSDGHHAVRQGEQAVHARQVAARAGGDGIGRHRHLAWHITASRSVTPGAGQPLTNGKGLR